MSKGSGISYEALKKFSAVLVDSLLDTHGLPAEHHPTAVLERWEAKGPADAMKSVTQGISDLLSFLKDTSPERRVKVDQKLAEVGAPSVALVSAWMSRKNGKILKRGFIETDEEFERVAALRDDRTLSEEERAIFQRLLDDYEFGK